MVDDSGLVVKKLSTILKRLGHEVVGIAKTGRQAVDQFRKLKPDLVTMDITMPDMNGIAATNQIIAEDPQAVIIMVTSHGQEKMVTDAIDAGAKGYVLKPFNDDKLAQHLSRVVEQPK